MQLSKLKIGHITHLNKGTGLTVFLFDQPAPCGYWLCGAAPATRDVMVLDPANTVSEIDALLFTGGSAFGLDAAQGVMQYLQEQGRGFPTAYGPVPIVPTASIYDFLINGMAMPTSEDAYQACVTAVANNSQQGRIGAGTGASVGKLIANAQLMSGGFGYAQINCANGLQIVACIVVNAIGNVVNANGQIVAGACDTKNNLIDFPTYLRQGEITHTPLSPQNTTLAVVFTNAALNKVQLTRVAKMASTGMARAIVPVFTSYDGDIVFAASVGEIAADEITIGTLGAQAIQQAILQAVQESTIIK